MRLVARRAVAAHDCSTGRCRNRRRRHGPLTRVLSPARVRSRAGGGREPHERRCLAGCGSPGTQPTPFARSTRAGHRHRGSPDRAGIRVCGCGRGGRHLSRSWSLPVTEVTSSRGMPSGASATPRSSTPTATASTCSRRCRRTDALIYLEHRQDVAGRIPEPGLPRAGMGDALLVRPDRLLVVALERDAGLREPVHGRLDVVDREVQDRVLGGHVAGPDVGQHRVAVPGLERQQPVADLDDANPSVSA